MHEENQTRWSLPTPSAFTDIEIAVINEWVKQGESLFLIADHMPFPGASEKLTASFGITFYNGFAMKKGKSGKDIFTPGKGLQECLLTKGCNQNEQISSLQSFNGQAFQLPAEATPVLTMDDSYQIRMPQTAWQFDKKTPVISAANFVQGTYMSYGKGKLVVFGEAAMFTAQVQGKNKFGMNASSASQNVRFLLNTMHWLDGILK